MTGKYLWLLFAAVVFCVSADAQVNCRYVGLTFRSANNIQNPSLEQGPATCLSVVSGGDITLLQGGYLPHLRCTTTNSSIWYLGECNSYGIPPLAPSVAGLPEPLLPIPDGKGMLAFADHVNAGFGVNKRSKATAFASCLATPLEKDFFYRFDFYFGFGKPDHRYDTTFPYSRDGIIYSSSLSPMPVTLYGLSDSSLLPMKVIDTIGSCLTALQKGWIELGTVVMAGAAGSWVKGSINFVPPANINVLAIGPACGSKPAGTPDGYYYYFVDNLRLYESYTPNPAISIIAGSVCDGPNAFATLQMNYATIYKGSDFQWYKNNVAINEKNATVTINKTNYGAGWYQCGVKNDSLCTRSDSLYIDWTPLPSLNVLGATGDLACTGDVVKLDATTTGGKYLWQDGDTTSFRLVTASGSFSVTIGNACDTITVQKTLTFRECPASVFVPSAFSPNNDKVNDVFRATSKGNLAGFKLSVYNRSGQLIFFSEDITKGWDGTVNHVLQSQGTYVWMINYIDGTNVAHVEKGTVTLIR